MLYKTLKTVFLCYGCLLAFGCIAGLASAQELPLDITADSLSADIGQKNAVFEGNVVAKRGDLTLQSDSLHVHQAQNKIERIVASGNIVVTRQNEKATGDEATYTPEDQILVLTGNVELTQGTDVIQGQRLIYDLAAGTARLGSNTANGQKPQRIKAIIGPQATPPNNK